MSSLQTTPKAMPTARDTAPGQPLSMNEVQTGVGIPEAHLLKEFGVPEPKESKPSNPTGNTFDIKDGAIRLAGAAPSSLNRPARVPNQSGNTPDSGDAPPEVGVRTVDHKAVGTEAVGTGNSGGNTQDIIDGAIRIAGHAPSSLNKPAPEPN